MLGYLKPTSNENKINKNIYQKNQALACLGGLDSLEVVHYQIRRFLVPSKQPTKIWVRNNNSQELDKVLIEMSPN